MFTVIELAYLMCSIETEGLPDSTIKGARVGNSATPGVVVDGNVVHSGGVPSREKIAGWLETDVELAGAGAPVTSGCGCGSRG